MFVIHKYRHFVKLPSFAKTFHRCSFIHITSISSCRSSYEWYKRRSKRIIWRRASRNTGTSLSFYVLLTYAWGVVLRMGWRLLWFILQKNGSNRTLGCVYISILGSQSQWFVWLAPVSRAHGYPWDVSAFRNHSERMRMVSTSISK